MRASAGVVSARWSFSSLPSLLLYAGAALAILGALGGIYAAGYRSGSDSVMTEWQEASAAQRAKEAERGQIAAEKKEASDAKAKVVYRTIYRDVDKLVVEYRDRACLDPDGLRLARDAIAGKITDPAKLDKPVRPAP